MWLSAVVVPCSNSHDVRHHKLVAYYLLVEQECCLDDLGPAASVFGHECVIVRKSA